MVIDSKQTEIITQLLRQRFQFSSIFLLIFCVKIIVGTARQFEYPAARRDKGVVDNLHGINV